MTDPTPIWLPGDQFDALMASPEESPELARRERRYVRRDTGPFLTPDEARELATKLNRRADAEDAS